MTRRARKNREVTAAATAAATAAVPAAAKGWMGDGMEYHRSPLTVARLHLHSSSTRRMSCFGFQS